MAKNVYTGVAAGGQLGFTIIEIMVTVSLLAVLMGLSLPSFSALIDRNRVESALSEYVFAIQSARSVAISRAAPAYICPSSDAAAQSPSCGNGASWRDGFIVYTKPDYTSSTAGYLAFDANVDELISQVNFPEGTSVKLEVAQVNAQDYIGFSSQGTIIQPAPNENPAMRVCGALGENSRGRVYRLSTIGRLSVTKASSFDCANGDFS